MILGIATTAVDGLGTLLFEVESTAWDRGGSLVADLLLLVAIAALGLASALADTEAATESDTIETAGSVSVLISHCFEFLRLARIAGNADVGRENSTDLIASHAARTDAGTSSRPVPTRPRLGL